MFTLFAIPKAFQGHIGIIQRNACESWKRMCPDCEIILFGDDAGTKEAAEDLGLRYVPHVARNGKGTPLVNDLFEQADRLAKFDVICYVNADIMLMSEFAEAVCDVARETGQFLMVGQRWDIHIGTPWEFESSQWEHELKTAVRERGRLHAKTGIDYFAYRRGLFGTIPPFALGRTMWDNWLVYRGRKRTAYVIDATERVTAVHQDHDYGKFSSREEMFAGEEALSNQRLRGSARYGNINDVTHLLLPDGLHSAWTVKRILRSPRLLAARYPVLHAIARILDRFLLRPSRPVRSKLGLTRSRWRARNS